MPSPRINSFSLALFLSLTLVLLTIGCLVVGIEPVGGDPDLLYRPLKSELARSLQNGTLPFWSDRLGLGVPLVAESHVAAFYPPNWIAYRFLSVPVAYRLMMALHFLGTAAAAYLYARRISLSEWAASLASVSFALCGFQACHASHEPLYLALPYLPLCLYAADAFAETGRWLYVSLLALLWGLQITIGHFQIPIWTGVLAGFTGTWRIIVENKPRHRIASLLVGLLWGLAISSPQWMLTRELTSESGFSRTFETLSLYAFPLSHWIQPVFPGLLLPMGTRDESQYWGPLSTSSGESTFYVGTIPLMLAIVGLVVVKTRTILGVWRILAAVSLLLATMPQWSTQGYRLVTLIPILGEFRCPGRLTVITSLALSLLAGRGLDELPSFIHFRAASKVGLVCLVLAVAWSLSLTGQHSYFRNYVRSTIPWRYVVSASSWSIALLAVFLWRRQLMPGWSLVALTGIELAILFHLGPVIWERSIPFPDESPIMQRLKTEANVGLIAGPLDNTPLMIGLTTAYPYTGITPPKPNYLLEPATRPGPSSEPANSRILRSMGVTHGIWHDTDQARNSTSIFSSRDETLDRILGMSPSQTWKIVKYGDSRPEAWVSRTVIIAPDWVAMSRHLADVVDLDKAWYFASDRPRSDSSKRATRASLVSWTGREAEVSHDGACDLVIRRCFYPGWTYQLNDGPRQPVHRAEGGLQVVPIEGEGVTRVRFQYEPTNLSIYLALSGVCVALAVCGVLIPLYSPRIRRV